MDRTHSRVERDLFETVVWFDRFFGNERMEITERPESFLRWMNDLRWDEEERFTFTGAGPDPVDGGGSGP